MRRILAGGLDGITGTNQFEAQAQPDGSAALLAPGTALMAWLFADPRVQSNLGYCVPLLAGFYPTLLAGRVDPTSLTRGQELRIGIARPDGPETAALLGLERLGLVPVPGLVDFTLTQAAFAQLNIDVMLLRGTSVAATLAASNDTRPICVLGTPDATGALLRDPALPDVPHLGELLGGIPDDPLSTGWRVAAVVAQQAFNLMLPPLTPAAMIALWQIAVEQAVALPDIRTMAVGQAVRLQAKPGTLAANPAALTALRTWFAAYRRK